MHTTIRLAVVALFLALLPARAAAQPPAPASAPAPDFLAEAPEVTAAIQKTYWDARSGRYRQAPDKPGAEFMWGSGIMFSAIVGATRHDPATYRPVLDRFYAGLDGYWDTKAPIPGYEPAPTRGNGNDKYYDDNAWMAITFLEAYEITQDGKYLDRAEATLKFVLSGWDDQMGGGIWWHLKHKGACKNTCVNAPAAVACLRLARYREREHYVDWARKLVAWTDEHLQDRDGLFFDHVALDPEHPGAGKVAKGKLTYNTALMIRADLGLWRATGDEKFLAEAKRIGKASDWFLSKTTGAYRDDPKWGHLLVEADLELYRATGEDYLLARARRNGEVYYARWQKTPPKELIVAASIARTLWLLADPETEVGRKFWERADAAAR